MVIIFSERSLLIISLAMLFCFVGYSQKSSNRGYNSGFIFSSEFYNVDYNALNPLIDSREVLGSSFGFVVNHRVTGSYATIEYQILQNYADAINLKGQSIYVALNYNVLNTERHILYPKVNFMISEYDITAKEDLNSFMTGDKLSSNYMFSSGLGIGYEYLFKLNFVKRVNQFSLGLNIEKSFTISDTKWRSENSSFDAFDIDLMPGIRTKILIRVML